MNDILSSNRQNGVYYTPELTAKYMVEKSLTYLSILDQNNMVDTKVLRILDPCYGDGIFILELLKQAKISKFKLAITGIDIQENTQPQGICSDIILIKTDFLEYESKKKFNLIICNPPYKSKRQSKYIKEKRKYIEKNYGKIAVLNLYVAFTIKATRLLDENGILCFILQDNFLTKRRYLEFRKFLLQHFIFKDVILPPQNLFHGTNADVKTVILILQKRNKNANMDQTHHNFNSVDRLQHQEDYWQYGSRRFKINQSLFNNTPDLKFFIGHPIFAIEFIIDLYNNNIKIGDIYGGGTGISTGNDKYFLKKMTNSPGNGWIRFYRNPGGKQYYYLPKEWIESDVDKSHSQSRNYIIRNREFFYKEGITCSSMGVEFSACYMESNSLFGINPTLFHENHDMLLYLLGFLNTKLATYILRGFINRSNMVTASYIKGLPFIMNNNKFIEVVSLVTRIIKGLQSDLNYNYNELSDNLDKIFYEIYGVTDEIKNEIEYFTDNIRSKI
ncbi:MAG: N-6 DNA methylase [Candidatus Heimdallarchaeota archaeon]|nr:N-6 DNA methylase [Candidatus Heimdallarchaeota archaeon]